MGGYYFFVGSNLEKCGKLWKNGRFSGRIWPDWGNTAWADMAGLGSIGLILINVVSTISKTGLSLFYKYYISTRIITN